MSKANELLKICESQWNLLNGYEGEKEWKAIKKLVKEINGYLTYGKYPDKLGSELVDSVTKFYKNNSEESIRNYRS